MSATARQPVSPSPRAEALEPAQADYAAGRFERAARRLETFLRARPRHVEALLMLGRIYLSANWLAPAVVVLEHALESAAREATPPELVTAVRRELAWALYRLDRFDEAARHFLALPGFEAVGRKLAALGERQPYRLTGPEAPVCLPLLARDPVLFVLLTVGSRDHVFLVDTGTGELTLDVVIMEELRLPNYGVRETTFAGDRRGTVVQSVLPRLRLGELVVEDVPVEVMDIHSRAPQIGGIIGLNFLLHFRPTFDYAGGQLVLAPRRAPFTPPPNAVRLPLRLFEDHILVGEGAVNEHETFLFLASGMAGTAFTCPESTLEQAGIPLPAGESLTGVSGAGSHDLRPFTVPWLRLGPLEQQNVPGVLGLFLPALEWRYGVRVGGLVGHDFLRRYRWTLDPETLDAWFEELPDA